MNIKLEAGGWLKGEGGGGDYTGLSNGSTVQWYNEDRTC